MRKAYILRKDNNENSHAQALRNALNTLKGSSSFFLFARVGGNIVGDGHIEIKDAEYMNEAIVKFVEITNKRGEEDALH